MHLNPPMTANHEPRTKLQWNGECANCGDFDIWVSRHAPSNSWEYQISIGTCLTTLEMGYRHSEKAAKLAAEEWLKNVYESLKEVF